MNMFAALPSDVSRKIYREAIRVRNEDIVVQVITTVMNAFDTACSNQFGTDYQIEMFDGSKDIARVTMVYDAEFARVGIHRYSVDIMIGDDAYYFYKDDYETDDTTDVSLCIVDGGKKRKYEELVVMAFRAMFENGIVYHTNA
jgi:hypothetical protein